MKKEVLRRKKSNGLLCQGVDVVFGFIAKHRVGLVGTLVVRDARCLAGRVLRMAQAPGESALARRCAADEFCGP
jgi:hypothetical protein